MRAIRTGLWWVFCVFAAACLLISLAVGRTPFTEQLFVIALVAFVPAALLEVAGVRR